MFKTDEGILKPIVYVGIIKDNRLLNVDYLKAPNAVKVGWWIPAPELEYGEEPQKKAVQICQEFGIQVNSMKLHDVESFVSPGGWHLLFHYVIKTLSEPCVNPNVRNFRWITDSELSEVKDMAHGNWEVRAGQSYLRGAQTNDQV